MQISFLRKVSRTVSGRRSRKFALLLALLALASGCSRMERDAPAHEAAAARELRAIASAQVDYARAYGGFACNLAQLGPPLKNVKPSLDSAGLIDQALAAGLKAGYRFSVASCSDSGRSYRLVAVPIEPGRTGKRSFCTDQNAVVKYAEESSADDCLAAGKPLQP